MASYPPPLEILPIFDTNIFNVPDPILTFNDIISLYAVFPVSTANQTLNNIIVNGTFNWSGAASLNISGTYSATNIYPVVNYNSNGLNITPSNLLTVNKSLNMTTKQLLLGGVTTTTNVTGVTTINANAGSFGSIGTNLGNTIITTGYGGGFGSYNSPLRVGGFLYCQNLNITANPSYPLLTEGIIQGSIAQPIVGNSIIANVNADIIDPSTLINNNVFFRHIIAKASCYSSSTALGASIIFRGITNYNFNITLSLMSNTITKQFNFVFTNKAPNATYIVESSCGVFANTICTAYVFNKTVNGFSLIPYYFVSSTLNPQNIQIQDCLDIMIYSN
jgi:hypothetical protein